jgi:hypothetical protein
MEDVYVIPVTTLADRVEKQRRRLVELKHSLNWINDIIEGRRKNAKKAGLPAEQVEYWEREAADAEFQKRDLLRLVRHIADQLESWDAQISE